MAGVMGYRDTSRSGVHMLPHAVGIRKHLQAIFTHFPQAPQKCPGAEGTDGGGGARNPGGGKVSIPLGPPSHTFSAPESGAFRGQTWVVSQARHKDILKDA